jgi:DNA-directed RNA polymerase specialized sigma24 family protein
MIVKALEKPEYFCIVKALRGAVFTTTRNEAINFLKKMRDWTGTGKNGKLARVPMEVIEEIPVPASDSTEEDRVERAQLICSVLTDIRNTCERQMQTESVRSDHCRTIRNTAEILGISRRTVTKHRKDVCTYATKHHAESRRQLFGPHHTKQSRCRRRS